MPKARSRKNRTNGKAALTLLNVVLCLFLALITISNMVVIVKGILYPDEPPDILGVLPMVVNSNVMEGERKGSIPAESLVFLQETEMEDLIWGDVVVYYAENGSFLIGRIESKEGDAFRVKGDNVAFAYADLLTEENLLGVISFQIPLFGKVAHFVLSRWGLILLMVLPLVVCICMIFIELVQRRKLKRQQREALEQARTRKKFGWLKPILFASATALAVGAAKKHLSSSDSTDDWKPPR